MQGFATCIQGAIKRYSASLCTLHWVPCVGCSCGNSTKTISRALIMFVILSRLANRVNLHMRQMFDHSLWAHLAILNECQTEWYWKVCDMKTHWGPLEAKLNTGTNWQLLTDRLKLCRPENSRTDKENELAALIEWCIVVFWGRAATRAGGDTTEPAEGCDSGSLFNMQPPRPAIVLSAHLHPASTDTTAAVSWRSPILRQNNNNSAWLSINQTDVSSPVRRTRLGTLKPLFFSSYCLSQSISQQLTRFKANGRLNSKEWTK